MSLKAFVGFLLILIGAIPEVVYIAAAFQHPEMTQMQLFLNYGWCNVGMIPLFAGAVIVNGAMQDMEDE